MSVRPSGWDTVCDRCGRKYGDTHDTKTAAATHDVGCSDCTDGRNER